MRRIESAARGVRGCVAYGALLLLLLEVPHPAFAKDEPSSQAPPGTARVLDLLGHIHLSLVRGRYHAITRVNEALGRYQFDCSGMAAWVLRQAAPRALKDVLRQAGRDRPVASDFVQQLWKLSPGRPSPGWRRIAHIKDLRGGDLIGWLKPEGQQSRVTGHVGFAVARAQPSESVKGGYLVRFADSSRYRHQDDTREKSDRDGFGVGTLLLVADPRGAPVAYGWRGENSVRLNHTRIVIGRPRR